MASSAPILCHIVTPIGMLGYGFVEAELCHGLDLAIEHSDNGRIPAAIILDSGSTDSGPSKLALGSTTCPRDSYVRDLKVLLRAVRRYGVPLLISSVGGAGLNSHVDLFGEIVRELAAEDTGRLKIVSITSGIPQGVVLDRLSSGKISCCGSSVPHLTAADVVDAPSLVAQMGPEPFVQALAAHPDADVILGGRSYDPSPHVAFAAWVAGQKTDVLSLDREVLGGFTHMGKVMECGGFCASPKSKSALATVYADGSFDVRPLQDGAICVPRSVAAHTLYEKARPDLLSGPGGILDVTNATYTAVDDGVSVHVAGGVFRPSDPYTIKLEGAHVIGYRTLFMGSFCDPILISQLNDLLKAVKEYAVQQHSHIPASSTWQLDFHIYDGGSHTDGKQETNAKVVFVVGEALADTQALATSIASTARVACTHGPYAGQKANSGNFGMGIGGLLELETGPCAAFSVYHLMDLQPGEEGATPEGSGSGLFHWTVSWAGDGGRVVRLKDIGNGKTAVKKEGKTLVKKNSVTSTAPPTSKSPFKNPLPDNSLGRLASTVRSKNAGPYEITVDVIFDDPAIYQRVKSSGVLSLDTVSRIYKIAPDDVVYCGFFDPALAFKATFPRRDPHTGQDVASGGFMEGDVHGSQKHRPLMELVVPEKE